ncbi:MULTISPECIES: hypothetical protein [Alcaligenaceae]|uniref:hypothetical protein n=1 Tax=Alcaligenaceae TaxID=506 RepID=UPI0004A1489C|nr:hypothetical protein [Bordetella bronchiseptica]AWQ06157.1 hypothetical protein B9G73_15980 [Bordetella bronchiseptica]KDD61743.1 hypothetical protein L533_2091 [Bordetella bronchiseptica OSU553]
MMTNITPHLTLSAPVMTVAAFSQLIGLEESVLKAQVNRGYWPTIKVGKRVFVNVEAVRLQVSKQFLDAYPL